MSYLKKLFYKYDGSLTEKQILEIADDLDQFFDRQKLIMDNRQIILKNKIAVMNHLKLCFDDLQKMIEEANKLVQSGNSGAILETTFLIEIEHKLKWFAEQYPVDFWKIDD